MMKKKISFIPAVFALLLLFTVNSFAATKFITAAEDYIDSESCSMLEYDASKIYSETGIGVYAVITEDETYENAYDLSEAFMAGLTNENCVVLVHSVKSQSYAVNCTPGLFTDDELASFGDAYNSDSASTYYFGVEAYMETVKKAINANGLNSSSNLGELFTEQTDEDELILWNNPVEETKPAYDPAITNVFEITEPAQTGASSIASERLLPRLVDAAGIIDDAKEETLLNKLDSISESKKIDVAIVTTAQLNGKEPMEFADDYFDYNGFGYGSKRSGILLLISVNPKYIYISTCGKGEKIITNGEVDSVIDTFYDDIKDGSYLTGCTKFADEAERQIKSLNRYPLILVFIAIIIGFLFSSIKVSSLKARHKTVQKKQQAVDYILPGSLVLLASQDNFIDKHVDVSAIVASTGSRGSGSSGGGHISSSGSHHGGGGRGF